MTITKVSYERLYNLGGYENERIGVEVSVFPDEPSNEAHARARALVEEEHRTREEERGKRQRLLMDLNVMESRKGMLEEHLAAGIAQLRAVLAALEERGETMELSFIVRNMIEEAKAKEAKAPAQPECEEGGYREQHDLLDDDPGF